MTTFEHALLGVNGLLATGLQRHYGWQLAALAGVAAIAPDWDGLSVMWDMDSFERGHRVWGHNLLACLFLAILIGTLDYRFNLVGRVAQACARIGPLQELAPYIARPPEQYHSRWLVWIGVAFVAALSQIPADAVVSGADGLSDWALKPFWPFSNWEFVYPLVPWGNVGVTIIFAIAMIAQVKKPRHVQAIAAGSLFAVVVYIGIWGAFVR